MAIESKGFQILVVDDDELILDMISRLLSKFQIRTDCTSTGNTALALYKGAFTSGKKYDAVIVDIHLPYGLTGAETIDSILQIDKEARIITTSGYPDEPLIKEFQKFGLVGALAKPFNRNQLREILESVFAAEIE